MSRRIKRTRTDRDRPERPHREDRKSQRPSGHRPGGAPSWFLLVLLATLAFLCPSAAENVEVAPGVQVTKRTYSAPVNEQPFYGFVEKSSALREADERFLATIIQLTGSREKAFQATTLRGWRAIGSGNASEAARRFNEAFLLMPRESEVYHGLAVVVQERFNDPEFAKELFGVARKQPHPLKTLNADFGRFLLITKHPREAQPVLEQAVKDTPDFGDAWTNLAWARLQNGDLAAACEATNEAAKQHPSTNASADLVILKSSAQCK
jgi:tetratricopeptide (TPR) repeat protein